MQIDIALKTASTPGNPLFVDRERGVIAGVAVITAGTTKPSGDGRVFDVDAETLRQVAAAINAKPSGVKARLTHVELEGVGDDLPHRVGYVRNARVSGRSVLADLHLHDPQASHSLMLFDVAESDPGAAGFSITSNDASVELAGEGRALLRVPSLDSVDVVSEPAANPAGMVAASATLAASPGGPVSEMSWSQREFLQRKGLPYSASDGQATRFIRALPPDDQRALRALQDKDAPMSIRATAANPELSRRNAEDALLIRLNAPLVALDENGTPLRDMWGSPRLRQPSSEALQLASMSVVDIGEAYLRAVGSEQLKARLAKMGAPEKCKLLMSRAALQRYFPAIPSTRGVTLAQSSGDFPQLLADALNKSVLAHWALARRAWRSFAKKSIIPDFKTVERVRLEDSPGLELVPEGASITFGSLPENPKETFSIGSYKRGFRFTRQSLLNDDTESLRSAAEILAQGAFRLEDVLAFGVLTGNPTMGDGNALFSTAHANTSTGTLTVDSLGDAMGKIANRTTTNGDVLDLQPARLLVPTSLKSDAENILHSIANAARHETESRLEMVSSAHLETTAPQWFVTTDPLRQAAVEMGFLQGSEQPQVDSETRFNNDAVDFRVRHDLVAAAVDHRAVVRSTGA